MYCLCVSEIEVKVVLFLKNQLLLHVLKDVKVSDAVALATEYAASYLKIRPIEHLVSKNERRKRMLTLSI
jgi:hypothetical protein